ncbi:hypothetical protein V1514DRAFT_63242 [Lipomyces japonicus]|uniref:uncharacterized protein n=1 Tax=Lipomyces japonicus TaxID=56871 RepID=UPI0034CF7A62
MRFTFFASIAACVSVVAAYATFDNVAVFTPPSNYLIPRVLYSRAVELPSGDLLATWENYSPEPPLVYFPIFKSSDHGATWKHISNVTDQVNGWGLRYQPDLFVLPRKIGKFPKGTILVAGNSIPTNLAKTQIDVYASTDNGLTWKFVSHVAAGGEAVPDNGLTPVWEPFFLLKGKKLIIYYSDQRDPAHGQKLDHQLTHDLVHWQSPVDDVSYYEYTARPGMPTVALLPNGKYIYAYEYGGAPVSTSYTFPVFYKISKDPTKFNKTEGVQLISKDGAKPTSSPVLTWSPTGGKNGTIIVSANSHNDVFINQALGDPTAWVRVPTNANRAYTRGLTVFKKEPENLLIIGAGVLNGASNFVSATVINITESIAAALA